MSDTRNVVQMFLEADRTIRTQAQRIAELEAQAAAQRRAGAAWALKEARRLRDEDEGVSMMDAVEFLTSAIERGKVEVPE